MLERNVRAAIRGSLASRRAAFSGKLKAGRGLRVDDRGSGSSALRRGGGRTNRTRSPGFFLEKSPDGNPAVA